MITLSHGYKKPANPDTGDEFFPAMEENIQLLNDHTHDGTDGALIALVTVNILAGNWVAAPIGGGTYRQLVTLPSNRLYDSTDIFMRLSTGEVVYPKIEKNAANSYYVYTNDNSKTYVAFYR